MAHSCLYMSKMLSNGSPSNSADLKYDLESGDWKLNPRTGILSLQEKALKRLINSDPIEKVYIVDPDPIARGQFATVYRCHHRVTGDEVAAKFSSRWRMGVDCSADIVHEIAVSALLRKAQRVVRLIDVFNTEAEIILVMEYATGGDLQTLLDEDLVPYERNVISFLRQLLEGLIYIHDRNIVHLDIKPQNLVLMSDFPDCCVKLCDFEISRMLSPGHDVREILGTADYVAPEIIHYEPITTKTDMWSFGVLTYVLLTGFLPFGGDNDQETFLEITRGELDFPDELFEDISEHAIDFIKRLLIRQPQLRLSAKECLEHEWMTADNMKPKLSPTTLYLNNLNSPTTSSPVINANLRQPTSQFRHYSNMCSSTCNNGVSLPVPSSHNTPVINSANLNEIGLSLEKAFETLDGNSYGHRIPKASSPINLTPTIQTPVDSSPRDTGNGLPPLYPYMSSRACLSTHSSNSSLNRGSSRQSLDRLKSMSKSREVLAERLQLTSQKKVLSKSRERLFDGRYGLYRSRDRLFDQRSFSHSVETLPPFDWMNTEDFIYNSNNSINMPMLPIFSMLPMLEDTVINNPHYKSMASIDNENKRAHLSGSPPKYNYFTTQYSSFNNENDQVEPSYTSHKEFCNMHPRDARAGDLQTNNNKTYNLYDRNKNKSLITKINSEKQLSRSRTEPAIPKISKFEKSKKDPQKRRKEKDRGKQNKNKQLRISNESKATKPAAPLSNKISCEKGNKTSGSHTEQRILERHERMLEKQEMSEKAKRGCLIVTKKTTPSPNRRHSMNENLKSDSSFNGRKNSCSKEQKFRRQKSFPISKQKTRINEDPLRNIDGSEIECVKEFINGNNKKVITTQLQKVPSKTSHNIVQLSQKSNPFQTQNKKNIQKTTTPRNRPTKDKIDLHTNRDEMLSLVEDSFDDGIFSRSNSVDSTTSVGSSSTVKAVEIPATRSLECTLDRLKLVEFEDLKSRSDSPINKDFKIVVSEPKQPHGRISSVNTIVNMPQENKANIDKSSEADSPHHDHLTIISEEVEITTSVPSYTRSLSSNSSDIGSMLSDVSEPLQCNDEAVKFHKDSSENKKNHLITRDRSLGVLNLPKTNITNFKLSRSNSIHLDTPLLGKPRPWGEVCNGSVNRAFQMFSQKSVAITVVGRKSSDPTSDRP